MYCKELLGFNFQHQKLRAKSTWFLISNFQHQKLKSNNIHISVSNFEHQKLNAKNSVQLFVQFFFGLF